MSCASPAHFVAPDTLDDAERGLALLLALSRGLRSWSSFKSGIERLLRDVAGPLGQTAGVLWLPRDGALLAQAAWTHRSVDREPLEAAIRPLRLAPGSGVAGHAWVTREPVPVTSSADGSSSPRVARAGGLRPTIGLPAVADEDVLGVIELYSISPTEMGERLLEALRAAAHVLGAFFSRRRGELRLSPLTHREVEVLVLAAQGLPMSTIGWQLAISRDTVKSHLTHIYAKLGVGNRTAAVAHALRSGLIE